MTEEKLNGLVIHDIPSKALFDELVKRGVIGEHDISFVEQDAVESLGITGASAGQVPVVNSVDENGVPNGWGAKDMPKYRLITDITVSESVGNIDISQDDDGNTFSLSEVRMLIIPQWTTDENTATTFNGRYAFNYTGGNLWNYGIVYDGFGVAKGSQLAIEVKLFGGYIIGNYSKNSANMGAAAHAAGNCTEIHKISLLTNGIPYGVGTRIIITGVDA